MSNLSLVVLTSLTHLKFFPPLFFHEVNEKMHLSCVMNDEVDQKGF